MSQRVRVRCATGVFCVVLVGLIGAPALGQLPVYSIDFQGPTLGVPDSFFGIPISEGDLLFPGTGIPIGPGPLPPPGTLITAGFALAVVPDLGLPAYPGPGPFIPGFPNGVEVDAVSFGLDFAIDFNLPPEVLFSFSVDEFAVGGLVGFPPEVATEGAFGAFEAAADVYVSFPPFACPPIPAPPFACPPGNTMLFDADGFGPVSILPVPPFASLGGLIEPIPPGGAVLPDAGDNLDALDMDDLGAFFFAPTFPVYFSLDASYPDPYYGVVPPNSASALINGFFGGDVLVSFGPGGPIAIYAPSVALGLDILGLDTDDLDALVLVENGTGIYEQSAVDFDWTIAGGPDMLLFSVRRGSAIIGAPDSRFGIPISEGDILTPPPLGSPFGTPPGIWMAAENLGLATVRSGFLTFGLDDDLDALDVSRDCLGAGMPDIFSVIYGLDGDCNGNFVPDTCDVIAGAKDCNGNFIPDACEPNSAFADLDSDGDVDANDFLTFSNCFNGSLNPPKPICASPCADIDMDGDVDANDFLTFSNCFNGSLNPPNPC